MAAKSVSTLKRRFGTRIDQFAEQDCFVLTGSEVSNLEHSGVRDDKSFAILASSISSPAHCYLQIFPNRIQTLIDSFLLRNLISACSGPRLGLGSTVEFH